MQWIGTPRLILRSFRWQDALSLYRYRSKPEVMQYQSWDHYDYQDALETIRYFGGKDYDGRLGAYELAVTRRDGILIGDLFFELSRQGYFVGYTFDSSWWHHGYAYEAMRALLGVLSQFHPEMPFRAVILPENKASIRLIKKLGFKQVSDTLYFLGGKA